MASLYTLANRANAFKRHHGADSAQYLDARRDLAAATIQDAIRKNLASAPPLTTDQAERLAALLRGGAR